MCVCGGRSTSARGLGIVHEGSASYLFLDGPWLSTEMLFCSLLEMMKVYLDDRGACWAAGLDVVQVERDKRHSTPLLVQYSARRPQIFGAGAGLWLGEVTSWPSSSRIPVSFQAQADPISPLTTHHSPHRTALSHFPQDSRRVCEGEMRCGVAVVGLLFAHKGLTQVRQLKVNRLAIFIMSRCHHHQPFSISSPAHLLLATSFLFSTSRLTVPRSGPD